jgi:ribosomal-protein-alanine N-acetyltransferase
MREYLSDGRIALRKYRVSDAPGLYAAILESLAELTPRGFYHPNFSIQEAEEEVAERMCWWEYGENFSFLIEELPGGEIAGRCCIEEIEYDQNQAALGWWVRTNRTRQGIATAAGRLAAQYAFENLHFRLLHIYTRSENYASRRVAEKLGARLIEVRSEENGILCAVYELRPEYLI